MKNIKKKKIKYLFLSIISFCIISFSLFAINKYYIEESNIEIDNVLVSYFETMNKKEFDNISMFLYPENNPENDEYILMLKAKSNAINLESIRLKKIYPAIVKHNIAIVGYEVATNANYKNQKITTKEIKTDILLKKNNQWYIAKPEDLRDYDMKYIESLFDTYYDILKKNISSDYDGDLYNSIAFDKVKYVNKGM